MDNAQGISLTERQRYWLHRRHQYRYSRGREKPRYRNLTCGCNVEGHLINPLCSMTTIKGEVPGYPNACWKALRGICKQMATMGTTLWFRSMDLHTWVVWRMRDANLALQSKHKARRRQKAMHTTG